MCIFLLDIEPGFPQPGFLRFCPPRFTPRQQRARKCCISWILSLILHIRAQPEGNCYTRCDWNYIKVTRNKGAGGHGIYHCTRNKLVFSALLSNLAGKSVWVCLFLGNLNSLVKIDDKSLPQLFLFSFHFYRILQN